MGIFNALKKVGAAIRGSSSSGSPANTPTAISSLDNPAPGDPELQARLQSAKIIETLVEIFGTPQENNRLEISEDRSPSSKFDNVLKTSNLLATQSEFCTVHQHGGCCRCGHRPCGTRPLLDTVPTY